MQGSIFIQYLKQKNIKKKSGGIHFIFYTDESEKKKKVRSPGHYTCTDYTTLKIRSLSCDKIKPHL